MNSKLKVKNRPSNPATDDSEESNQALAGKLDLSCLRQPIATSVTGFEEVLRAYEAGTNELRKLLSRECDLIYECKVCRNIFRSLTNFISHKRVYCRNSFDASQHFHFRQNGFQHQDISTIIEAEDQAGSANVNGILHGSEDIKSKDLSGIVERLLWKQHQSRNSNVNNFYDEIQSSHDSTSPKSQTLKLDRVNDSGIAVYQSLQVNNDNSSMRNELAEVHKMMTKSNTVLGPDGKVLSLFKSTTPNGLSADESLTCQVCHEPFDTEKTLKLHLELKHLPSTYLYQCPTCSMKFSTSGAVFKHLSNDHNKNVRRIRMMRDNIIKKRVRADEVVKKTTTASSTTSREVQKLHNGTEVMHEDSEKSWNTNDLSGDYQNDSSYNCPSCFKKFERKTVYTNHVLACSEAKCRENTKLKKQKAKEEAKIKEAEENSTQPQPEPSKRKRKKVTKIKKEAEGEVTVRVEENSSIVDWNLDDEEERLKIESSKNNVEKIVEVNVLPLKLETEMSAPLTKIPNVSVKSDDDDDDDEESALVIDEKIENDPESESSSLKCPQCDKVFDTDDKLKYHTNTFHSRQKRFKCKMCEYQGYRKKDTMNHLNYVHNIEGDKEKLESLMESVIKSMDEESLAKQNELKRNQLKIKRRMERQKKRQNKIQNDDKTEDAKTAENVTVPSPADAEDSPENALKLLFDPPPLVPIKMEKNDNVSEFKEPPIIPQPVAQREPQVPAKLRRKSLHTSVLIPPENNSSDEPGSPLKIPKMFIKAAPTSSSDESPESIEKKKKKRAMRAANDVVRPGQSLLDISKFGKVVKRSSNGEGKDGGQRPIRNRIKPVNKDFLYDLSDLLKKDADAYREQVINSSTVNCKRELRKRAMSTHTRETPTLNSFDDSSNSLSPKKVSPMVSPPSLSPLKSPSKDEDDIPLMRIKENKLRRMSVFQPSARPMFSAQSSETTQYSRSNSTNPNTGAAYKMALKEFNCNRASLFEPKFLWTVCFNQDQRNSMMSSSHNGGPSISAASTILQRLSGRIDAPASSDYLKSRGTLEELDIPQTSENISVNPDEKNGLIALALKSGNDVCVLQECSADTDDESEKPSASSSDADVKKTTKTKKRVSDQSNTKTKKPRKNSEKRKSGTNGQGRRLTVMQRLQENKIRKTREQLFQRLVLDRQSNHSEDEDDNDEGDNDQSSPNYNLFSES